MSNAVSSASVEAGLGFHRAGDLVRAQEIYREVLRAEPRNTDALQLLGVIASQSGRPKEAVELIRRAIELNPTAPKYHNNLGVALRQLKDFTAAADSFREAIRLKNDFVDALNNLGAALCDAGCPAEAEAPWKRAAELQPASAEAQTNVAALLNQLGRFAEALEFADSALALRADLPEAHANRSSSLRGLARLPEAAEAARSAIELRPNWAEAHVNLGCALQDLGEPVEAAAEFRRAIAANPNDASIRLNLGNALQELGEDASAEAEFDRALQLAPALAEAHWCKATACLLRGDWLHGWEEMEWRWRTRDFTSERRQWLQPVWRGEELRGRTILLHGEQGAGDMIQFVRYAPLVTARGGKVIVQCAEGLAKLFRSVAGVAQVVVSGETLPPFDVQAPLMSLPRIFKTTPATVPAKVPYLIPPPIDTFRVSKPEGKRLNVGLVWAGNPSHKNDRNRSLPAELLQPLIELAGIAWLNLQVGPRSGDWKKLERGEQTQNLAPRIRDFTDTAAALAQLDLLVTVDTSVAHLAGALGRPVWVLIPFAPEWRWMIGREDSPWYPTMRLFRQSMHGDWRGVIERVARELAVLRGAV